MLKLGIVSREGLRRPSRLGIRRQVSVLLLRELARDPSSDHEAYDRLVANIRMPNGTWKLTCRGRLRALDDLVLDIARGRWSAGSRLAVLDLAASTGVTSAEFYRSLSREFAVDFVASDLYRDLLAVQRKGWTGVFDCAGHEVQHVVGAFVMPGQIDESIVYPVNRLLKRWCRSARVPAARAVLDRVEVAALEPWHMVNVDGYEVTKLPLVSSECLALLASDEAFRFEAWDVLRPLPQRGEVVRAMNILTTEHFSDADRRCIVAHCVSAVVPGGLFVVGWSPTDDPDDVLATVYEVGRGELVRLASLNGGSEIDEFLERTVTVRPAAARRLAGA